MTEPYKTVEEMAKIHRMTQTAIRKLVNSGEWPGHKWNRRMWFTPADEEAIDRLTANGAGQQPLPAAGD